MASIPRAGGLHTAARARRPHCRCRQARAASWRFHHGHGEHPCSWRKRVSGARP